MLDNKSNCINCSDKCSIFKYLTQKELEEINKKKYKVHYRAGEIIFKQGTSITHIISLNHGLAKAYIESYQGNDLILTIVKPTVLLTGPGTYIDNKHHFTLRTLRDSSACFIEIDAFKAAIRANPDFAENYISYISMRTSQIYHKLASLAQKQISGRVAEALLYFSEEVFESERFDIILSRKELAELTSTTKESVCRVLADFKRDGYIDFKGNDITIINNEALEIISEKG